MDNIFLYVVRLNETFGLWSLALVGAVFLLMLPVNYLFCKVFLKISDKLGASDSLERIRKSLSSIFVFVIAGVVVAAFSYIFRSEFCIEFICVNAIPVGVSAMLLRAVYKIVRDNGIMPLVHFIIKKSSGYLVDVPIDSKLKSLINEYIDEFLKLGDKISDKNEAELIDGIKHKLDGFCVDADRYAVKIISLVNKKRKKLK